MRSLPEIFSIKSAPDSCDCKAEQSLSFKIGI